MSERKYILCIDQGTSATKAILFDAAARVACRVNVSHDQYYPGEGWVEHDAQQIWNSTVTAINGVIRESKVNPEEVAAISITDQTETFMVWDRKTGVPVYHAIVWQDNRAEDICNELADYKDIVEEKTGIMLSTYYSAAKMKWMFDNVEGIRERAERGELLFGTVECWLIWKLTGGARHVSDYCNASRSQLVNIHTLDWDEELLRIFGFPSSMFPSLKSCNEIFGHVDLPGLPAWPITGVIGDSPAALFGQMGFDLGSIKVTYGTGSSVLMNLGDKPTHVGNGILTTIGWVLDGKPTYVCEGSIICSAATIRWMEKDLELIRSSAESDVIAAEVPDTGGVYLVPAFTGLGAPYWNSEARAAIIGMSRGTRRAHVVRAGLESIAYQIKDAIETILAYSDVKPGVLRADGGASRSNPLMQFQSDILDQVVACGCVEESSALGAAMIGGCTVGLWSGLNELRQYIKTERTYTPSMTEEKRAALYSGWKKAVSRILD